MPELPEVETVVRDLRPHLQGRRLLSVEVSDKKLRRPWSDEDSAFVVGRKVKDVSRRGKWILFGLDRGSFLLVHLGMTGQLTIGPANRPREDHTHLTFALDKGLELRFRDIRRFGSATVLADEQARDQFFREAQLGPEPEDLDPREWAACLQKTDRPLKAALLDQRLVAGVGNIYADEALFEARLQPSRRAKDLTSREAERLRRAIGTVLSRAIERRGSSIRNYVGGSGLKGGYQAEFRVYGRTGEPCRRCRTPINRIRLAGRSTHFCSRCQG